METKKGTAKKGNAMTESKAKSEAMPKNTKRTVSESTREKLRENAENENRDDHGRFEAGMNNRPHNSSTHKSHDNMSRGSSHSPSSQGNSRYDEDSETWVIIESTSCDW